MNKKRFFAPLLGVVVLGLSAYAGYCTYNAYYGVSESDLLLANVEALATSGEAGAESRLIVCYSSFDSKGTGTLYVKDCNPCGVPVQCVSCFDQGKCRP